MLKYRWLEGKGGGMGGKVGKDRGLYERGTKEKIYEV